VVKTSVQFQPVTYNTHRVIFNIHYLYFWEWVYSRIIYRQTADKPTGCKLLKNDTRFYRKGPWIFSYSRSIFL